jgi:predicted HAD superfamily hydrolase
VRLMKQTGFVGEFMDQLDKVELVTFDIFDTAVVRGLAQPEDLFLQLALTGRALGLLGPVGDDADGFSVARREAERQARHLAWVNERRTEIRLEEIYRQLAVPLQLDVEQSRLLMEQERALEIAHCRRNAFIGGLYEQAISAGKRVGFLSDMYLDHELVARILDNTGYAGYNFLHVSSTTFECKATSVLYRAVLKAKGGAPERWLHIGDNRDSDVLRAQEIGIRAMHYPKCHQRLLADAVARERHFPPIPQTGGAAHASLFRSQAAGLIANAEFAVPERNSSALREIDWDNWGYRHAGPLLAGFGLWLVSSMRAQGLNRAYFLSRDGYLIKAVVDRILNAFSAQGQPIETRYLYASRRAYNLASILELNDESLDFLVSGTSRMSPRQFLARIDIDADAYADRLAEAGFTTADEVVDGGEGYGRLRALFRLLKDEILLRARTEFAVLQEYFSAQGLLDGQRVAVVDLGWHGSLQNSLHNLVGRMSATTCCIGYYMGTFPASRRYRERGLELHGYLCEEGEPATMQAAIKTAVEIFEWIFSAPHGSVCQFTSAQGEVSPVFADFDFESGRWQSAQAVQAGALRFIDDYLDTWRGQPMPHVPPEEAVAALHRALAHPTLGEAIALGDIQHAEGFGRVAVPRYIARPPGSVFNPFHYPALLRGYRSAFWRAGYRRRLMGQLQRLGS